MSTVTTSPPSRKAPSVTFRCDLVYGADRYTVAPIADVHPEIAIRAFQMRKNDGPDVYVRLTTAGDAECNCKAFQRWHGCKHVLMLAALGCLPITAVQKANAPESEPATSRHRSAADMALSNSRFRSTVDMARNSPDGYARLYSEPEPADAWAGYPETPDISEAEMDAMARHYGQN
jgi:hypothetical protein